METIYRDYSPKGVRFFYIYKALAHPEYDGYVTPFTLEERLLHIKEAKRRLGSDIAWISDDLSNQVKHQLGNAPNAEFVIDPEGKVARRRLWSRPEQLRKDLEELVGAVDRPTRVEDLNLQTAPIPTHVAKGIVPGVETPGGMRALRMEPRIVEGAFPFYAKLRAEADSGFFREGKGQLYLGFHLDPLYKVHWNNKVKPLSWTLSLPEKVKIDPVAGSAPEVEQPADSDPREFLLDIEAEQTDSPVELTVKYFACDDADTFCVPVEQSYRIHLERDGDGGTVIERTRRRGSSGGMLQRILRRDSDGDGKISLEEAPPPLKMRFTDLDANKDGFLDEAELKEMMQRRRGEGRPRGRP